jgi:hypothetical protein
MKYQASAVRTGSARLGWRAGWRSRLTLKAKTSRKPASAILRRRAGSPLCRGVARTRGVSRCRQSLHDRCLLTAMPVQGRSRACAGSASRQLGICWSMGGTNHSRVRTKSRAFGCAALVNSVVLWWHTTGQETTNAQSKLEHATR